MIADAVSFKRRIPCAKRCSKPVQYKRGSQLSIANLELKQPGNVCIGKSMPSKARRSSIANRTLKQSMIYITSPLPQYHHP